MIRLGPVSALRSPLREAAFLSLLWALAHAGPALADADSSDPPSIDSAAEMDEIVVTAQKREERLQDVPLSVSVIDSELLGALKWNETTDLSMLVPGLSQTNAAGPRSFGFFLRGIGTTSFASESIESSTAFVLDGVVLGQAGAALMDLPDVERVEVLRGPQGTLFGKNASAGVISVTTRPASEQWRVDGSLSLAWPEHERKLTALVSGPLSERARVLISGRTNLRDGTVENRFDGRDLNDRDDYGTRAKLDLTPRAGLSIRLIGDVWRRDANCCIWSLRSAGPSLSAMPEQEQIDLGIAPGPDNREQNIGGDLFTDTRSYGASAQVDVELGEGHTLTSITAWRRWLTHEGLDSDSSPSDLLDVNGAEFAQQQRSQELRLSSPTGGWVDYVAGLFYFDSDVESTSSQIFTQVPLPFFARTVNTRASTTNLALFGQANVHWTDRLTLIAGGRVLSDEVKVDKRRSDLRLGLGDSARERKRERAVVWRGGLQYDLTPDLMAFATVNRGFKAGGFDTAVGQPTLPEVEPETPTSYEIGLRTVWLRGGLIANLTAFSTRVKGFQTVSRDPVQAVFSIGNAESRARGVEFDLLARPFTAHDLSVGISAAYVDARWRDFSDGICYPGQTEAQGCVDGVQRLTNEPIPFTPKWTASATLHWAQPVYSDYQVRLDLSASYRGRTGLQFPNSPWAIQPAYALLNAAIAFGPLDGRWSFSIYGRNLGDETYAALMFPTPFGTPPAGTSHFIPYEAQRIIGVALDFSFQ